MATPIGIAVASRQAASGYALRVSPRRRTYTTSWDINHRFRAGGLRPLDYTPWISCGRRVSNPVLPVKSRLLCP